MVLDPRKLTIGFGLVSIFLNRTDFDMIFVKTKIIIILFCPLPSLV